MKILITGSSGKLGKELSKIYTDTLKPTRNELDLTNRQQVFDYIAKHKPDIIIHLAALTGIRECEEKKELAWKTNIEGTGNLIDACEIYSPDCYFVHMSTPCVFSGGEGNYVETDIPHPKNYYSLTKAFSELVIQRSKLENKLILRGNFVPREKWPYPKAFIDRFGTYLFADDLARAIKEVIEQKVTGVLHILGDRKLSMFELAKLTTTDVEPMTLKDYQGPPLTVDMSLDTLYPEWKKFKISSIG